MATLVENKELLTALSSMEVTATVFFALAVLHTFLVRRISALSHHFRPGSPAENLFHFLGEVEVVFGIWATLLMVVWSFRFGTNSVVSYLETVNYTEAAFVFVVMAIAATRPVMSLAQHLVFLISKFIPLPGALPQYFTILTVGPILGSLITEPAAMTISALLLRDSIFKANVSTMLKYITVGLLFVNISIGGSLTHFAAPPVVMVAHSWDWDLSYMFWNFGWKALAAVFINVLLTCLCFYKEISQLSTTSSKSNELKAPYWTSIVHIVFITLTVFYSHHMSFFIPLFLLFLGWIAISEEHQDELQIRQALLVGYFLGGLVTLGKLQAWWLKPTVEGMTSSMLFWGATALTAVTDNAALTYLGTLVPTLDEYSKYTLVAGALTGGGLTVIANAPNPAGYSILSPLFGSDGISPSKLFIAALPFTIIAAAFFLLL